MSCEDKVLVKWLGGKDDGKFTSGVPLEWIRENPSEVKMGKKVIVEWRNPKKKPVGGYPCFNAVIINIGGSIKDQESIIAALGATLSPKSVADTSKRTDQDLKPDDTPKGLTKGVADKAEAPATSYTKKLKSQNGDEKKNLVSSAVSASSPKNGESGLNERFETLEKELKAVKESRVKKEKFVALEKRVKVLEEGGGSNKKVKRDVDPNEPIKIGNTGDVYVPYYKYEGIANKSTYTSMGISLMTAIYPLEVLKKSNVMGGARKVAGKNMNFQALDKTYLLAIEEEVQSRFPNQYNQSQFHTALNNKLNKLRGTVDKSLTQTKEKKEEERVLENEKIAENKKIKEKQAENEEVDENSSPSKKAEAEPDSEIEQINKKDDPDEKQVMEEPDTDAQEHIEDKSNSSD